MAVFFLAVCEIFSVKEWHDLENLVRGCSRSFKMAPFDWPYTIFLLIRHCKYSSILHYERDKAIYWLKIAIFSYPCIRRPPRPNIAIRFSTQKLERFGYPIVPRLCIASRGKKWSSDGWWEWQWWQRWVDKWMAAIALVSDALLLPHDTLSRNRYQKTCTGFLHVVEQCSNPYEISVPEKIGIELHDTPAGNRYKFSCTGFWYRFLDSMSWALG